MIGQNSPSNIGSSGANKTTNYFNNYFNPTVEISQNINDAILSYFEEQTGNKDSAKLLVQSVIDTAKAQNEDPMTVLAAFQNLQSTELSAILSLYLNVSRVNTSYLGTRNVSRTNPYVARTIVV